MVTSSNLSAIPPRLAILRRHRDGKTPVALSQDYVYPYNRIRLPI